MRVKDQKTQSNTKSIVYETLNMDNTISNYAQKLPRLNSWKVNKGSEKMLSIQLLYKLPKQVGQNLHTIDLSIFTSVLQDLNLNRRMPLTIAAAHFPSQSIGCRSKLKDLLQKPAVSYSMTFLGGFGVGAFGTLLSQSSKPKLDIDAYFLISLASMTTSATYFVPVFFFISIKKMVDSQSLKMANLLKSIKSDLENGSKLSADYKINNIGIKNKITLYYRPDLMHKYYYLYGKVRESFEEDTRAEKSYINALAISRTSKDKYLTLKSLICLYGKKIELDFPFYSEKIKNLVVKLPHDQLYNDDLKYLKERLNECISEIKNENYRNALNNFSAINWNVFFEFTYPTLAIIYYQLKVILTLCGQDDNTQPLDPETRMNVAYSNLLTAQKYVEPNDLEYKDELKKNIRSFELLLAKINNEDTKQLSYSMLGFESI